MEEKTYETEIYSSTGEIQKVELSNYVASFIYRPPKDCPEPQVIDQKASKELCDYFNKSTFMFFISTELDEEIKDSIK